MAEILEFQKSVETKPVDLVGRLMMLNTALADPITKRFQCGGFLVNTRKLVEVVSPEAQQGPIRAALERGVLIDVTDNDIARKGFEYKSNSASRVDIEDTNKKVFITRDAQGQMVITIPETDEESVKYEEQIKAQGFIEANPEESDNYTGFSGGIIKEDI